MNDEQVEELMSRVLSAAFPIRIKGTHANGDVIEMKGIGLSKREFLAGMAMQGAMSGVGDRDVSSSTAEAIAREAVMVADELIKQLNKK